KEEIMRTIVAAMILVSLGELAAQSPGKRAGAVAGRDIAAAGCQPAAVPPYTPPARTPQKGGTGGGGKADGIDGAVTPTMGGRSPYVNDALTTSLAALKEFTRTQPDWIDGYMRAENSAAAARTPEGRLWLRVDALRTLLESRQ